MEVEIERGVHDVGAPRYCCVSVCAGATLAMLSESSRLTAVLCCRRGPVVALDFHTATRTRGRIWKSGGCALQSRRAGDLGWSAKRRPYRRPRWRQTLILVMMMDLRSIRSSTLPLLRLSKAQTRYSIIDSSRAPFS